MPAASAALLAVESATRVAGVAVLRGGELLAATALAPERPVSETLLPAILEVLARAAVPLEGLGALAVSIGPGSFTGLRVGLATVKGLAFEPPLPVVAVPTLEALAWAVAPPEAVVAAVLDAQRGEVYGAVFRLRGGASEALVAPGLFAPEDLAGRLPAGCVLVGEAAERVAAAVGEARVLDPPGGTERAVAVGRIGLRGLARGEARPAAELVPHYLRRAEAEVRRGGAA